MMKKVYQLFQFMVLRCPSPMTALRQAYPGASREICSHHGRDMCRWCARQLPAAAQGMCIGWSRHLHGPWRSCYRWCARQDPRSIECLKWAHFFQTASRLNRDPVDANVVRARHDPGLFCAQSGGIRSRDGPTGADGVRDCIPQQHQAFTEASRDI